MMDDVVAFCCDSCPVSASLQETPYNLSTPFSSSCAGACQDRRSALELIACPCSLKGVPVGTEGRNVCNAMKTFSGGASTHSTDLQSYCG